MKRLWLIVLLIISSRVYALDKFDLMVCKAQESDKGKLECYKKLNMPGAKCNTSTQQELLNCLVNHSESLVSGVEQRSNPVRKRPKVNKNNINDNSAAPARVDIANLAKFERIGYFKGNKDRVFTIKYSGYVTRSKILEYAGKLPYTAGGMTSAYFYKAGSVIPNDGVTLAKNSFSATNIIYYTNGFSSWQYVFMIFRNGTKKLINCNKRKSSDLCKQ